MELPSKIEDKIVDPTNFDNGVFYFSNPSKEEFKALWNNIEYIFPPMSCTALLIPDHTAIQIQEIRKRFAFRWAEKQWFESKEYKHMVKIGRDKPSARDDSQLEPLIQMCLTPLPLKPLKTQKVSKKLKMLGVSKPVDGTDKGIKYGKFDTKAEFEDATQEELTER